MNLRPETTPACGMFVCLDTIWVRSIFDDAMVLREVLDVFLHDAPARMHALRMAVAGCDAAQARRLAHSLKGMSGSMGAPLLAGVAREAEAAAQAGDLERLAGLQTSLDEALERTMAEVAALREAL